MRRRTFHHRGYGPQGQPMSAMNVTPFIDVLLVLLIMIIMTVPILTHETEVDLPTGIDGEANPLNNTVAITSSDQLLWNGTPVSRDALRNNIAYSLTLPTEPTLHFAPEPKASYDRSVKTIHLIKETGAQKFAFRGNHLHRNFGKAE